MNRIKEKLEKMKNIDLGDITVHNLKQLKKLNQIVFPVSYNDKFYKDILEIGPLAKLGNKNCEKNVSSLRIGRTVRTV